MNAQLRAGLGIPENKNPIMNNAEALRNSGNEPVQVSQQQQDAPTTAVRPDLLMRGNLKKALGMIAQVGSRPFFNIGGNAQQNKKVADSARNSINVRF